MYTTTCTLHDVLSCTCQTKRNWRCHLHGLHSLGVGRGVIIGADTHAGESLAAEVGAAARGVGELLVADRERRRADERAVLA